MPQFRKQNDVYRWCIYFHWHSVPYQFVYLIYLPVHEKWKSSAMRDRIIYIDSVSDEMHWLTLSKQNGEKYQHFLFSVPTRYTHTHISFNTSINYNILAPKSSILCVFYTILFDGVCYSICTSSIRVKLY